MIKNLPRSILVTGFEPFDGMEQNPSGLIARAVDGSEFAGYNVIGAELPVDYLKMPNLLYSLLEQHRPVAVLGLGLASGRPSLSLERLGVNLLDFKQDNAGHSCQDRPIIENAPAAYFATLPLRDIQSALVAAAIPCYLSESAGLYLCNQMLYSGLHFAATQATGQSVGFMHLPALPEMLAMSNTDHQPFMRYETQLAGVRLTIQTIINKS